MTELYAHSLEGRPTEEWQTLDDHLENCAELAKKFAQSFNSSEWAEVLGFFHDGGKARAAFQNYIRHAADPALSNENAYDSAEHSHSGAGACFLFEKYGPLGLIFAYCIAGHHAGLPDYLEGVAPNGALKIRLAEERKVLSESGVAAYLNKIASKVNSKIPLPPWKFSSESSDVSFWIRMLYSALVDADYLDTEHFMQPDQAGKRSRYPSLAELAPKFFSWMNAKEAGAPKTEVNLIRKSIKEACEEESKGKVGLYSLTVPTGGGKTLSGTDFALNHALMNGQKRIIYVIPYTSIIEQTADVLREIFGEENVVEHHSNIDLAKETQESKLSTENWDAPVIVTTTVQFFESLYGCRSSQCRKLHNIAESVVILDEVQLLPPQLLWPCTEALAQLVKHYRTTILLSTATQPALEVSSAFKDIGVKEIIPDPADLYRKLKRTEIEFPSDLEKGSDWASLATELSQYPQVLCIVNTRGDCKELAEQLIARSGDKVIYLSTWLCGAHRSALLKTIKQDLEHGRPIKVVSTQLVEAGVDLDFPVVYRAFTGLSSIAQAAGRCNREGRSKSYGKVKVFISPKRSPIGELRKAEDSSRRVLNMGSRISLDNPDIYKTFFECYYESMNSNGKSLFKKLLVDGNPGLQFQFREASCNFKIIKEDSESVVVSYGRGKELIETLREEGLSRELRHELQRYTVNVRRSKMKQLLDSGLVELLPVSKWAKVSQGGIYVQTMDSGYDEVFGFNAEKETLEADELIF